MEIPWEICRWDGTCLKQRYVSATHGSDLGLKPNFLVWYQVEQGEILRPKPVWCNHVMLKLIFWAVNTHTKNRNKINGMVFESNVKNTNMMLLIN